MKAFQAVTVLLFTIAYASAYDAEASELELREDTADARLFFVNFTSSLVQVNATILLYGLIFLGIIAAAAIALYYLYLESQSGGGYGYGSGGYGNSNYHYSHYARSATSGYDFNAMNILSWISMMQDAYDNFDFNDLECQKRLICEVLREPEYFGNFAYKAKTGFHWGGQLASMVTLPDDVRELVDEYMDASDRSADVQECKEYYQCPYSIKDSISKNIASNSL